MIKAALLYHIYSGHFFFTAAAFFIVGILVRRLRLLALLALPLAALSGTPMPLWLAVPVVVLAIAALISRRGGLQPPAGGRRPPLPAIAAIVGVVIAVAFELPYHLPRHIATPSRLFVIGDSLASGGFGEQSPWPVKLGARNLSSPSETAQTALQNQIALLPPPAPGDCVIVEIGGNDMLNGRPVREFASALDAILAAMPPRTVVMLELPVVPGAWRYGAAQRRLARKHRATLVPKRVLAGVLLDPRNTTDGLHLTERGHAQLARDLAGARPSRPQSPGY